ncbi:MAG: hypothetical protein ACOY31_12230 [Bacillota bacterium]
MNFVNPGTVIEDLDMEEQQLLLTCLVHSLGTERVYEITRQTAAMLRENDREAVADILDMAAKKMVAGAD